MSSFWTTFAVGIILALIVSQSILWIITNLESHTPEWREERLINWLRRPLPTLGEEYRKKIVASYPSEEWEGCYPYLMIDAICNFENGGDEVTKWAINYSTTESFRMNDKEYLELL